MPEIDEILDVGKAAKYLGISRSFLYKLTSGRTIAFFKPNGKRIYFLKSDLDKYLLRIRIAPEEETADSCERGINEA